MPPIHRAELSGGVGAEIVHLEGSPVIFVALVGRSQALQSDTVELDSLLEAALGGVAEDENQSSEDIPWARVSERGLLMVSRNFSTGLEGTFRRFGRLLRGDGLDDAEINRAKSALIQRARFAEGQRRRSQFPTPEDDLYTRLYGEGHPRVQRRRLRTATIEALSVEDVRGRLARLLNPTETTLIIVGDVDPAATEVSARATLGEIPPRTTEEGIPRTIPAFPDPPIRLRLFGTEGGDNAITRLVEHGPPVGHPDHPAFRLLTRLAGGMFSSGLNLRLRESRGDTYGVATRIYDRYDHSILMISLVTPVSAAGNAAVSIVEELSRLSDAASIEGEELLVARNIELASLAGQLETNAGLGMALSRAFLASEAPDSLIERYRIVASLDAQEVAAAARRWLRPEKAPMYIVGNAQWLFTHEPDVPGGVGFIDN